MLRKKPEVKKKVENDRWNGELKRIMLIRTLCYLGGLFILSFGVTMTILAGIGAGPWDALNVGLAMVTPFSVGNWVIFIGMLLIILNGLPKTRSSPNVS